MKFRDVEIRAAVQWSPIVCSLGFDFDVAMQDAKAAEKAAKKAKAAVKEAERKAQKDAGPTDKQVKAKEEADAKKVGPLSVYLSSVIHYHIMYILTLLEHSY